MHFEPQSTLGTIDEEHGRISVAFSLPPKPFQDNTGSYEHAVVTVSPLLDPNPAVATFRYPNVPQLNEFYGREAHFDYSKARIEEDGLGIVIRAHESDLRLRGIPPLMLAGKLFGLAGIETTQSNAGKVALRVIQHMGGIDSCRAFKITGVRNLLHEFTPTKHFSHSQALARIGPNFGRFKRLFIEPRPYRGDLTPQDVFLYLVKKKVFRPGIELECTNCLLTDWHSLNNLGEQVCGYATSLNARSAPTPTLSLSLPSTSTSPPINSARSTSAHFCCFCSTSGSWPGGPFRVPSPHNPAIRTNSERMQSEKLCLHARPCINAH